MFHQYYPSIFSGQKGKAAQEDPSRSMTGSLKVTINKMQKWPFHPGGAIPILQYF